MGVFKMKCPKCENNLFLIEIIPCCDDCTENAAWDPDECEYVTDLKIIDENHDKFEVDADFCFRVSEKGILQALTPGQKGLATYCLLEALSEISEINFPLIVDSPGQGIDLEYINAIFEHVLSLSRRQVIILPNTAEISSNPKKSFGPATSLIAHIEKPRGSGKSKVTDIHRRKKK